MNDLKTIQLDGKTYGVTPASHAQDKNDPHNVTAEQVGAAIPADVKKASPVNLLDNSDFRNPVNQRGFAGGELARNQYCVDRWLNYNETDSSMPTSLSNKGVTISNTGSCSLAQFIPQIANFYGKTMTVAVGLADGTVICGSNVVPSSAWSLAIDIQTEKLKVQLHTFDGTKGVFFIHPHQEITVAWAALYEGEYTAETLPEYHPKGYGAELAECQRYALFGVLRGIPTNRWSNFIGFTIPTPVTMRNQNGIPSLVGSCLVQNTDSPSTRPNFTVVSNEVRANEIYVYTQFDSSAEADKARCLVLEVGNGFSVDL